MRTSIVLLFSILSLFVHADIELISNQKIGNPDVLKRGGWSSGGGNAVVCFMDHLIEQSSELREFLKKKHAPIPDKFINSISSIEMFDLYSAKLPRGIEGESPEIMNIKKDERITDYVFRVAKRFDNNVFTIVEMIYYGTELIEYPNIRFHNTAIIQKEDANSIGILDESRCMFTTMAIQRSQNEYSELHIDARLFNYISHSRQSKATLLIHEYIYAYARTKMSAQDSYSTRIVVENAISKYRYQNANKFAEYLLELGFLKPKIELSNNVVTRRYTVLASHIGSEVSKAIKFALEKIKDSYYRYGTEEVEELADKYSIEFTYAFDVLENRIRMACQIGKLLCAEDLERLREISSVKANFLKGQFSASLSLYFSTSRYNWSFFSSDQISLIKRLVLDNDSYLSQMIASASISYYKFENISLDFTLDDLYNSEEDYSELLWLGPIHAEVFMPHKEIPFITEL